MPSSYTTNLGIELPNDGELDGVWGDVVNANMDILDRAINGGVTLTLSGASSTLTTTDGTLSNGQYKLLILGGTPSGTHTITVSPNDAKKLYYVYNLSGQSVVFSQGSGATVTVATGDTAVIYCDGAGSGAGVINVVDHFAMNSVRITGGTITGITDIAVADGGTGASDAATARTNLGLGTISTQSATSVTITGGTISGITDLAVADGGTGASDAATARTNLGAQATITGAATTITASDLTASRALASNASGKVVVSTVTDTELGYLSGVTSSVQTQINGRVSASVDTNTTAGYTATADADGTFTSGTYTPTPSGGNIKTISNGGAFTIAAPSAAGVYTLIVEVSNVTGAGTISTSGFARVVGDSFTTTVGHRFQIVMAKTANGVVANVVAMQ